MRFILLTFILASISLSAADAEWVWEGSKHLGRHGKGREFGLQVKGGEFFYKRLLSPSKTQHHIPGINLDPVRRLNGKLVDLSFKYRAVEISKFYGYSTAVDPMEDWGLKTVSIIQVLDEGFLFSMGSGFRAPGPYYLHAPNITGVAEDDVFLALIKELGTFRYTATTGASKTVRRFEYGTVVVGESEVEDAAEELREKYEKEAQKRAKSKPKKEANQNKDPDD